MARLLPLSLLLLASRAFGWIQLTFEERCSTVMDMEPWDSASTSYTTETERWYPKTITKTTQNTSYYTPKPVTTTSSVEVYKTVWTTLKKFDKRADYLTKTKHLTHTHHSTTISTVTYNATVTITVTTSTLLTIPTPRGFIPVRNSTRAPVTKRSPHPPGSPFGPLGGLPVPPNLGLDAVYPKSVECTKIIFIQSVTGVTSTAPTKTITKSGRKATHVTSYTRTITHTSVSHTHKTTTTTDVHHTTTKPVTKFTTVTPTTTTTVTSTQTAYEACNSANILGPLANGKSITNVFNNGLNAFDDFKAVAATSAHDCCTKCFDAGVCEASVWLPKGAGPNGGVCLKLEHENATCSSQRSNLGYYVWDDANVQDTYVVSNGPCGLLYNGGQDGGV